MLRVKIKSLPLKARILRGAKQLRNSERAHWRKLYITPDLTAKERELDRKLRMELRSWRDAGEENIYIRHGKITRFQEYTNGANASNE